MATEVINKQDFVPADVYKRRWWILAVLCLSLLVVMVGNTTLNVALPVLSRVLHASNSQLQWMVDAYSLVFAGFLFTAGAVGDRYGRKGILQAGLVLFGLASAYTAFFASSAVAVIAARAVMGLAGAMIMPATLSILTNIFPPNERARAVGLWAGVSGAGVALGPLMSGFVLEHFSWHATFTINLPIIALTLLAGMFLIPKTADPAHTSLDPGGAVLSIAGLTALVYAIIQAPTNGWLSTSTLGIGALGLVSLAAFIGWELRAKHPMLDVRLFKIPAFGISSLSLTLVFFALMGMFFSISMLMQLIYGYSPLGSAIRMLPVAGTLMVAAPLSTPLAKRFGKRRSVAAGMLTVALGTGILSMMTVSSSYLNLVVGMVIMAFGMGIAMSPTTDLLMSAVPRNRAGMGSAMNDTTRELGGALGIAVLGSLLASQYSAKIAPAIAQLPEAARTVASQSLAGAMAVAQLLHSTSLVVAAKAAWMSGYSRSLIIGSAVIALASVVAFFGLPDTAADEITEEGNFEVEDQPRQVPAMASNVIDLRQRETE